MKTIFTALATTALLAVPALAGGPTVVPDDPTPMAPTPAAAHDWSGAYLGLGVEKPSADWTFSTSPTVHETDTGVSPSIFAGYLFQRGSLVYGGELAYTHSDIATIGVPEGLNDILDVKGRIGFATGKTLVYGVIGYSASSYYTLIDDGLDMNGPVYGLGAEFAVSERVNVGLEYLTRKLEGDTSFPGQTRTFNTDAVTLRVSFAF